MPILHFLTDSYRYKGKQALQDSALVSAQYPPCPLRLLPSSAPQHQQGQSTQESGGALLLPTLSRENTLKLSLLNINQHIESAFRVFFFGTKFEQWIHQLEKADQQHTELHFLLKHHWCDDEGRKMAHFIQGWLITGKDSCEEEA